MEFLKCRDVRWKRREKRNKHNVVATTAKHPDSRSKISRYGQSRSQSFVPLDQRSENESSGSIRFEITMGNNRILVIWFTAQSQSASISCYGACLKWLLPELSFSDRWSRGTKLWERDCATDGCNPRTCAVSHFGGNLLPVAVEPAVAICLNSLLSS